jgi:hypothetical protein
MFHVKRWGQSIFSCVGSKQFVEAEEEGLEGAGRWDSPSRTLDGPSGDSPSGVYHVDERKSEVAIRTINVSRETSGAKHHLCCLQVVRSTRKAALEHMDKL